MRLKPLSFPYPSRWRFVACRFVAPVCGLDPWSVALESLYAAGAMAAAADRRMQTPACQSVETFHSPKTARATPEEAHS